MRSRIPHALALTLAAAGLAQAPAACGGGGTGGSGGAGGAGGGGAGGDPTPAESCKHPGDTGNVNGVGTYCTPGGNECLAFPLAGVCLADFGQTQWFCTRIGCTDDAMCGAGALCHVDPAGSACVPLECEGGGGAGGGGSGGAGGSGGSAGGGAGGAGGN